MSTRVVQRRRMILAVAAVFAVLGVALIATSPEAAGAPGNLPAPLGQATNAGVSEDGCPAGDLWTGFDANGGPDFDGNMIPDFGPVAVKIQPGGRVWVADFRNSITAGEFDEGRLYSWPSVDAAQGCTQPDRQLDGLNQPEGIDFDGAGSMYLTDTGNNRVLKFTAAQLGTMTTVGPGAKTASPAVADDNALKVVPDRIWGGLGFPRGIEVGPDGRVYVADDTNNRIAIYEAAGANDQVPAVISGAGICSPKALTFIGTSLFVANFSNCNNAREVIRVDNPAPTANVVVAATFDVPLAIDMTAVGSTLLVTSVAGGFISFPTAATGMGERPPGTPFISVTQSGATGTYEFRGPTFGIDTIAGDGNPTLVADAGNFRVLQFDLMPVAPMKVDTTTELVSSKNPVETTDNFTLTATVTPASGNVTPTGTVQFQVGNENIGAARPLDANGVATVPINNAIPGDYVVRAVYNGSDAFNTSQDEINLVVNQPGNGKIDTTTTVASNNNPADAGEAITFTATIDPATGNGTPTGTVTFFAGEFDISGAVPVVNGVATLALPSSEEGNYEITAFYSGDDDYNGSVGGLDQVVGPPVAPGERIATTTAVAVAPEPTFAGEDAVFTATITPASGNGTPTGSVQFQVDGFDVGQPQAVNAQGRASIVTDSLSAGPHTVRATYSGSATYLASTGTRQINTAIVEPEPPGPGQPGTRPDANGTSVRVTPTQVEAGDRPLVEGFGWPAGSTVRITLESDPVLLATVTADADGRIRERVTIPTNTPLGDHLIVLTGSGRRASARLEVIQIDRRVTATTLPGLSTTTTRPVLVSDDFGLSSSTTARTTSSTLPKTGAGLASQTNAGAALLTVGAILVLATERRRIATVPTRRRR